jgi:chromosome segregation ATPase
MAGDRSKLRKGLFGYRKTVVEQVLEDRELMVRAAEERVLRAERRVHELEAQLHSLKALNARLEGQMDEFGEQLDSLSARVDESIETETSEPVTEVAIDEQPAVETEASAPRDPVASKLVAEELTSILIAGQVAAARMIERARDEAQRQIVEANHLLGEVHAGVRQFSSWRADVQPAIVRVQSFVDVVRNHIAQTPERVSNALAPLADVMFAIDSELAVLAGVCHSPFEDGDGRGPEGGRADETFNVPEAHSIWLTVEEDELTVAEGEEDEVPLEASAG